MKATDWGIVISRATEKLGYKTIGVMGLQNAFVLPIMNVFQERMAAAGRKVVDSLVYNPEQPSYRAEVERICGKKPEAVYCFGLLPDFVSIMREVYRGGFDSKVVALSIMADAEGKFVQAVGPQVADGIRHFQPMPDLSTPGYKRFLQLMGAPADRVYLFPPNTHDQDCDHGARHGAGENPPRAVDWSKQIITVGNGPGETIDDIVDALKLVRAGKSVNFQGAGSTCDFAPIGDQMGRGMGQWIIFHAGLGARSRVRGGCGSRRKLRNARCDCGRIVSHAGPALWRRPRHATVRRACRNDKAREILAASRSFGAEEALGARYLSGIVAKDRWGEIVDSARRRSEHLSPQATAALREATVSDTRAEDMAALVSSVSAPGIKQRIRAFREASKLERGQLRADLG